MKNNQLFKIQPITDRITRIIGISNEIFYLIVGEKKAALLDSGVGVGNVKALVVLMVK